MVGKKKAFVLMVVSVFLLSGCSVFTMGSEASYCIEHGADYTDAGVCDDPMTIYENRHALADLANRGNCSRR